ncbi:hypothetical protein RIF29_12464 [Crotalaria pallida]|uniref:CONSTANS-like protein n=1 Tax=Crotalaria pallida TaxID=3830 RepID=A0AAN9IN63_CROPI
MASSKLCDSCKSSTATLFCRPDSAFLCLPCDSSIHSANSLASRHPRVPLCEVCEHAPAHVTCKADAASLCFACDHDIHSANPLAARHERIPVAPFFYHADSPLHSPDHRRFFGSDDVEADVSTEEAEAASWLLPNPKGADLNSFSEMEAVPCVDLGYDGKTVQQKSSGAAAAAAADGVVPVQSNEAFSYGYKFYNSQSQMSHSVSSSEAGVVPDENTMTEIYSKVKMAVAEGGNQVVGVAADREARVLRYREKRKNRKFEKTIRYASRKAYAETRPRIKGRFAKRSEADTHQLAGYGIVPTC